MFFRIKMNKNVFQIVICYTTLVNVVWHRFLKLSLTKTSLKIRKWWSKAVHWRRTDNNTLSKRKRTKRIYNDLQTPHRKLKIKRKYYTIIALNWFSVLHNTSWHKMKCCNCFIAFNIPVLFGIPGSIFRDYLLLFFLNSNSKAPELIYLIS